MHNPGKIVNNLSPQVHDALRLGTIPGVPMATKRTTRARRTAGEGEIYEAVLAALLDGRLPAGTPLREQHLAAMFGATRGRARKVLMRLGHEGRLEADPEPRRVRPDALARRRPPRLRGAPRARGGHRRDARAGHRQARPREAPQAPRRRAARGGGRAPPRLRQALGGVPYPARRRSSATRRSPNRSSACSCRRSSSSRSTSRRRSPTARRPSTSRSSRRSPPATSSGRSRS